jgi:formylmethanofuran dehydrogenase subunit C
MRGTIRRRRGGSSGCVQSLICNPASGLQMRGGTLFPANPFRTAWMSRGTIIALEQPKLLPTFLYACTCGPTFLLLLLMQLEELGVSIPEVAWKGLVRRYTGDTSELGKGEILVCLGDYQA